jgi:Domain of unknown function (DUF4145)
VREFTRNYSSADLGGADMADHCPICLNVAEKGRDRDFGEKKQFRCPRCGPFEISRTASAMLGNRLEQDPLARARLSHAVRSDTSETNWLFISSANIDELLHQPLPGIPQQLDSLVRWLAAQLGDNRFGHVVLPAPEHLAGVVGTADEESTERLIAYAVKRGLVDVDHIGNDDSLGLTPEGWSMVEPPQKEEPKSHVESAATAPEIVKAHCNKCDGERNAYRRASHAVNQRDGEISWSDTYDVLECCGCNSISVRHEHWFSEWDDFDLDSVTGQPKLIPGIKVTSWPPPTKRRKPEWVDNLDDDVLRGVADEVYQALDAGLIVLASIGTRTLLDRAMFLRVGDPRGGFAAKLDEMVQNGHIGEGEKETLEAITDAGSAAAHRGFAPSANTLTTIVEAVENFLHREFVLKTAAKEVRKATPPRTRAKGN